MILKLVLLGTLTITSYRPVPEQTKPECTDRHHCETSIGENVSELGCAISRDLLKSGEVHYGDTVYIEGYGIRIVDDSMGPRATRALDMFVYTRAEEKKVGTRQRKVWLVKEPPIPLP